MRQRLGLTVSGAVASSLMKPLNFGSSQTILAWASLMTPLSGNRASRPRRALAKSLLSDHGSEPVEFLLNCKVEGDGGLASPAVCACCAVAAAGAKAHPPVARARERNGRRAK